ncbi:MAG: restriction endonuclease subunit S, partial [Halieaceae bacterium]|nr:restriction endonuclease subunit S [Halieaceae bacterium]
AFAEIDRAIELSNAYSKHADALLEKLIVTITSFAGEGEVKKIADVTEMQSGYAFKSGDYSDNAADTPLLRGDNIAPDSIDFSKAKRLPTDLATDYKKFELLRDDVILAMDRPYISTGLRLAKINEAHLPCLLVQRVMRLRTKPNLIPDFLHLAMQKPCFLQHILGNQTGLGVPHISGKTIGRYEFAIPDLQKQSHIVAKANKAKSQIKKLRASHEKCAVELTKLKSAILSQELQPPQSEAA